jgi:UDP-GlcNAc:undecaprenyl-phosphate/decaprenyl-phosphate GlcNAc-1-phosphate transferase
MTLQELLVPFALLFLLALAAAWLLQALIYRWAHRGGLLDGGDWCRAHAEPIARWGGAALWPALLLGLTAASLFWPELWRHEFRGLLLAGLLLTLAGLWDDMFGLHAWQKLAAQAAAAVLLALWGYRLGAIPVPFQEASLELGPWDVALTVVAVVLLINAVNLLEGINGSPAVYGCIVLVFLLFLRIVEGAAGASGVLVVGLAACLGFLGYNLGRIKTFLGDTGAMVLALIIASELLRANAAEPRLTVLAMPVVLFGIPILQLLRFQAGRVILDPAARPGAAVLRPNGVTAHRELVVLHAWIPGRQRASDARLEAHRATRARRTHWLVVAAILLGLLLAAVPAWQAGEAGQRERERSAAGLAAD